MKYLLVAITVLSSMAAMAADRAQLKEFRDRFMNQQIVINADFLRAPADFLVGWQFVSERRGTYETDNSRLVPTSLVNHRGTIIAIVAPPNIDGNPANQSDTTFVQYAEAIVKVDTGQLVKTAIYSSQLTRAPGSRPQDAFSLVSTIAGHRQEAADLARRLSGKSLYLTRLTPIYDMGLDTSNIRALQSGVGYSEARITDVPLLQPLRVIDTRYSQEHDFTIVVLQLPGGREAIYVLGCVAEKLTENNFNCASTSLPTFLSPRDIQAIRAGQIVAGMSEMAVYMVSGRPDETKASSKGQSRLIYGRSVVYLNASGRVVEIRTAR